MFREFIRDFIYWFSMWFPLRIPSEISAGIIRTICPGIPLRISTGFFYRFPLRVPRKFLLEYLQDFFQKYFFGNCFKNYQEFSYGISAKIILRISCWELMLEFLKQFLLGFYELFQIAPRTFFANPSVDPWIVSEIPTRISSETQ